MRGSTAVGKGAGECGNANLASLLCVPRDCGFFAVLFGCPSTLAPTNNPFCKPTTRGAAPGSNIICCEREVVNWGHPNYPPNNPELPPNNPQRTLKYPSRTLRHPSELHHNYPPTTPQLHPNNPKPPIKTVSAMYQVPPRQTVVSTR
jgi:hypothetical protein